MIFVSYSKDDIEFRNRFKSHFEVFKNQLGINAFWIDNQIETGANWSQEINHAKEQATVAVFLVSTNFLKSEFIKNEELNYFIEKGIKIYWFLLEPCNWNITSLAEKQAVVLGGERLISFEEYIAQGDNYKVKKILSQKSKEMFQLVQKQSANKPIKKFENVYTCNRQFQFSQFHLYYDIIKNNANYFIVSLIGKKYDFIDKFINKIIIELNFNEKGYHNINILIKSASSKTKLQLKRDLQLQFWKATNGLHDINNMKQKELTLNNIEKDLDSIYTIFINITVQSNVFSAEKMGWVIEWIDEISRNDRTNLKALYFLSYELQDQASDIEIKLIEKFIAKDIKDDIKEFVNLETNELPVNYNKNLPLPVKEFGKISIEDVEEWCSEVFKGDLISKENIIKKFKGEKTMSEFSTFIKNINTN